VFGLLQLAGEGFRSDADDDTRISLANAIFRSGDVSWGCGECDAGIVGLHFLLQEFHTDGIVRISQ